VRVGKSRLDEVGDEQLLLELALAWGSDIKVGLVSCVLVCVRGASFGGGGCCRERRPASKGAGSGRYASGSLRLGM
jgi:hypothetical protein